jgi:hypothetical protein
VYGSYIGEELFCENEVNIYTELLDDFNAVIGREGTKTRDRQTVLKEIA